MTSYIVGRLLLLIPTIIGITLTIHIALRLIPGDVVDQISEGRLNEQQKQELRHDLGLDKNVATSYVEWVGKILQGDMGKGVLNKRDVGSDVIRRLLPTIEMATLAMLFAVAISIPVGIVSAVKQETIIDHIVRSVGVLFIAVPSFWFALLVITYGFVWFNWTPPLRYRDVWDDPAANLRMVIVPAFILSASLSGVLMRITRSTMLEVLRQDYVRTARAKGLGGMLIIYRHVMRNALIPIVTILGVQVPVLVGGTVVLESIFTIPGMGTYLINGLNQRDYPVVQAVVLLLALVVVFANIVVDLSYSLIDPRVRYG